MLCLGGDFDNYYIKYWVTTQVYLLHATVIIVVLYLLLFIFDYLLCHMLTPL